MAAAQAKLSAAQLRLHQRTDELTVPPLHQCHYDSMFPVDHLHASRYVMAVRRSQLSKAKFTASIYIALSNDCLCSMHMLVYILIIT